MANETGSQASGNTAGSTGLLPFPTRSLGRPRYCQSVPHIFGPHSGHNAGAALANAPTAPEYVIPPHLFRTMLLERLQLPLQIDETRCSGCQRSIGETHHQPGICRRSQQNLNLGGNTAPQKVLLRSQRGPMASAALTVPPTSRATRSEPQPFRLCRRLFPWHCMQLGGSRRPLTQNSLARGGLAWWCSRRRWVAVGLRRHQSFKDVAKARAQAAYPVQAAYLRRWSSLLICSLARAFDVSLLERRPVPGTGQDVPPLDVVLRDARFQ